jgi:hypothetical protein
MLFQPPAQARPRQAASKKSWPSSNHKKQGSDSGRDVLPESEIHGEYHSLHDLFIIKVKSSTIYTYKLYYLAK